MAQLALENLRDFGPVFVLVWVLTVSLALARPQRYLNSFLLMMALLVSMLFLAGFLPEGARGYFLMACFLLVSLLLFLVPVLLIINGIEMIRRESFSPAHLLSLGLGVIVGVGEIAAVIYVFGLSDILSIRDANFWVLFVAVTVFYFSFLVLCFVMYTVFIQIMPHRMNFDYVIIHGCGLAAGERMTKLLSNRVDRAIELYEKSRRRAVIIPSGGKGRNEKRSEAQAMKDYLLAHGIPEESILIEDRSATTRENLLFSKALIDARPGGKKTALVSSNYHIYRCLRLAREVNLRCTGIGARVASYYWPSALIREFLAVFLTKRFLLWSALGYLLFSTSVLYVLTRG